MNKFWHYGRLSKNRQATSVLKAIHRTPSPPSINKRLTVGLAEQSILMSLTLIDSCLSWRAYFIYSQGTPMGKDLVS